MKNRISLLFLLYISFLSAQKDSVKTFSFSGYAELYYSYDFLNQPNSAKPNFIYNHKRNNELNINLAYAKATYAKDNIRGNFALMLGTYAQYNLSAEPEWARFVNELNVGIKLSKSKNIWLDAGVLPSHIGFESAVGADCWTLTRSILAENSPYYETGLKLTSISKNEKLTASFLVLNGWQCIQKPASISRPSFGGQLTYKPSGKLVLNYSNFAGFAQADSLNAFRLFHNLYGTYDITNKLGITMGLDFGTDKYNPSKYGFWYSPVVIAKYSFNERNRLAFRAEYYNDEKQIIIPTNTPNGFQVFGTSINYDYKLANSVWWRTEMKYYSSLDKIFTDSNGLTNMNIGFTTALTVKF